MKIKDFITISKKWISIGLTVMLIASCATITSSSISSTNGGQISSSVISSVEQVSVIAVEVDTLPTRITYTPVDVVSTQGGVLRVVYSDYRARYIPMNDSMIDLTRFDTSKLGTSNITIRYQELGVELFTAYTVNIVEFKIEPINLSIDIISSDVLLGESFNLNYIIEPLNATYDKIVWTSSNPLIASVDQNGFVNAKNVGEVIITVNVNDSLMASTKLNVKDTLSPETDLNNNLESDLRGADWIPIANGDDLMMIGVSGVSYIFAADNPIESVEFSGDNLTPGLSGKYYLLNSIDLSSFDNEDYAWSDLVEDNSIIPIGFSFSNNVLIDGELTPFTGEFDGNNNKISGMKIQMNSNYELVGLFSSISGGEVYDLEIELSTINKQTYIYDQVGLLAGYATNTIIKNVTIDRGSVIARDLVGGLVGYIDSSSVENSSSSAIVDGEDVIGGLIGEADFSEIIDSSSTGSVNGIEYVGGFIGVVFQSKIEGSYATGMVSGEDNTGGLVGNLIGNSDLDNNNYYFTKVTSSYYNPASPNKVSGRNYVGGLIGYAYNANVFSSYSNGDVEGVDYVGGLIGKTDIGYLQQLGPNIEVVESYATGNVTSTSDFNKTAPSQPDHGDIGGLIGEAYYTNVGRSYSLGNVTALNASKVGGLIGHSLNSFITLANASGNVNGDNIVGGLVGKFEDDQNSSSFINNSFAEGNVIAAANKVGGLVGEILNSSINSSFATGDVTAISSTSVGGLIGSAETAIINNSYSETVVIGNDEVGGLIGAISGSSSINNSYSQGNVKSITAVAGGFVASLYGSVITNSYFIGNVEAVFWSGGFVGVHNDSNVTNSYVIANVKRLSGTDTNIGYFVGFNAGVTSVFINNFYNSDAVIVNSSNNPLTTSTQPSGISAKNTAEMKNIATYTTAPSDWDFATIWRINPSKTGYPELVWQD
jgi:hypothetical protein